MTGLVPFAVLVSTVAALKGQTVVGANVLAAPEDPVTSLLDPAGAKPLIAVFVGAETHKPESKDLLEGPKRLEVAFQVFLPETTQIEINGVPTPLDTRGLGAEVVFAALWRQCMRALQEGTADWSRRWNSFVPSIHEVITESFLFELPGKVRGFAREITVICETADEPEYGSQPYPFWQDFIAGLRELEDYGDPVADLLAAEISAPAGLPAWRIVQASMGESLEAARALGYAPLDTAELGAPPVLESVELDDLQEGA